MALFNKETVSDKLTSKEIEQLVYSALRYQHKAYGLVLDEDGWIGIDTLIYRINFLENDTILTRASLIKMADGNPKFSLKFLKTQIKANELNEEIDVTVRRSIPPIKLYLYLTENKCTKKNGEIVPCTGQEQIKLSAKYDKNANPNEVLKINSEHMFAAGYVFFRSDKDDWYTSKIPLQFITITKR